jgi:hypothetical protein
LTAVAVWDHKPIADELLTRRVELGYTPTCSLLKEGATVLGHAACLSRKSEGRTSSGPKRLS